MFSFAPFHLCYLFALHPAKPPSPSSYVDFSVPLKGACSEPIQRRNGSVQAASCMHELLMIIFSFEIMWNLPPLFRKGTMKGWGPSRLPFLWSSVRTLMPSWWASKLWSRLHEAHYCHQAFDILFQVHWKARPYERYWEVSRAGGRYFLRALTPGPPLAAPPQKWRGRMAPLLLAWNSQWPLVGMDVPCPRKTRPLLVIKEGHHLRNKDNRKTLDFSLQIMTSFLLVWHGAAIELAHLRWTYCCMCHTDFLSQICNPKGLAVCYVF